LRATGAGTYKVIENGFYFSFPRKTIFEIKSGTVVILEVTSQNRATGTFEFDAEEEESGKKVKITVGNLV
jgi:hypothetical protein